MLPCQHTFCLKCLENVAKLNDPNTVDCPLCRDVYEVPAKEGVGGFKSNLLMKTLLEAKSSHHGSFQVWHLLEFWNLFCKSSSCSLLQFRSVFENRNFLILFSSKDLRRDAIHCSCLYECVAPILVCWNCYKGRRV